MSYYGLERIVRHPSLRRHARSSVITSLEDPDFTLLRDMIHWELYSRNDRPVIGLPLVRGLLDRQGPDQLKTATHMVTNRTLTHGEEALLRAGHFERVETARLPFPGPQTWTLWARRPAREQEQDFSHGTGDWEVPPGYAASTRLAWAGVDRGRPGRALELEAGAESATLQLRLEDVDALQVGFDWRAWSPSPSGAPRVSLHLVDAATNTERYRRPLTLGDVPDTGWVSLPPTDLSAVLPDGVPGDWLLQLRLQPAASPSAHLLLDNVRLVRREADPLTSVRRASDLAPAGPWSPWVDGPSDARASLSGDELEGRYGLALRVEGSDAIERFGLRRRLPVARPFVLSAAWRADGAAGTSWASLELLDDDGATLTRWMEPLVAGWRELPARDLTSAVSGRDHVVVRLTLHAQGGAPLPVLRVADFAWTQGCDAAVPLFRDADGDGHGDPAQAHPDGPLCWPLSGWSARADDCDDADDESHAGAAEWCDGRDNDCDPTTSARDEVDVDGDGQTKCGGDCDDDDPGVFRGAQEVCDGLDNDCDGRIETETSDFDRDAHPLCQGDCDDSEPDIWPGAVEVCFDGVDQDCDGTEARHGVDDECVGDDPR